VSRREGAAAAGNSTVRKTFLGLERSEWAIAGVATGLHALVNGLLPRRFRTLASLAACIGVSRLAAKAGSKIDEQGLSAGDMPRGVLYGLAAAGPIAVVISAGLCFQRSRVFYRQERITDATAGRATYDILLRIPLGTALPEEVIFRGALLAVLSRRHHPFLAAAISSVLFGIWHIVPTFDRLETNAALRGRAWTHKAAWILMSVGATTAAGLALAGLRYRSRSIVAPWIAHSAANIAGYAGTRSAARFSPGSRATVSGPAVR
jgi:CAAX protease family protein